MLLRHPRKLYMKAIDPISRLFAQRAGNMGPLMLMYHSIQPGKGVADWPWAVSRQRFCEHLDLLADLGWSAITMAELVAAPEQFHERTVVITFDDGYLDNLVAAEELQKRGMRASFFMVSGSIGREPGWAADGRPSGRLLDATELRAMQTSGMEIGSHTVNHIRLTEANDNQLRAELTDSKASLEDALGSEVSSFAYPYGAWDARSVNAVRETGYRAACTTRTGWALRDGDPCQLRRLCVFNTDTGSGFGRKLYFGTNDVSWRALSTYARNRLFHR